MFAELEQSGLVESLVNSAAASVQSFGASEVTLTLDGLARLKHQPSTSLLDALAQRVGCSNTSWTLQCGLCNLECLHTNSAVTYQYGQEFST